MPMSGRSLAFETMGLGHHFSLSRTSVEGAARGVRRQATAAVNVNSLMPPAPAAHPVLSYGRQHWMSRNPAHRLIGPLHLQHFAEPHDHAFDAGVLRQLLL